MTATTPVSATDLVDEVLRLAGEGLTPPAAGERLRDLAGDRHLLEEAYRTLAVRLHASAAPTAVEARALRALEAAVAVAERSEPAPWRTQVRLKARRR